MLQVRFFAFRSPDIIKSWEVDRRVFKLAVCKMVFGFSYIVITWVLVLSRFILIDMLLMKFE